MKVLTNKTAIVTGASKGIGAGIAKMLAQKGANVIVNYNKDKIGAAKVVTDILKNNGIAEHIQADVTNPEAVTQLFKKTIELYGKVDILVNNAGVYQFDPLEAITHKEFNRQFTNNVWSVLSTCQEAAKQIKKGGSIINISSVATIKTTSMTTLYTATKGALDGITRVLSKELAVKNIRVNGVLPGPTITEGNPIANTEMEAFLANETPLGRVALPTDIAPVVAFLASEESAWITGQNIVVSGGFD